MIRISTGTPLSFAHKEPTENEFFSKQQEVLDEPACSSIHASSINSCPGEEVPDLSKKFEDSPQLSSKKRDHKTSKPLKESKRANLKTKNNANPLLEACYNSNFEEVKRLVENKEVDVNKTNEKSESSFLIACEKGNLEIVRFLIKNPDVDLNQSDINHATPFLSACYFNHLELVRFLLENEKIDVNKAMIDGSTPLSVACQREHLELVKLLLNNKRINIKTKLKNGISLFTLACTTKNYELIKVLLNDMRIDINETSKNSPSPLLIACASGDIEIVKLLLQDPRTNVNQGNGRGETPFIFACDKGNLSIARLLTADKRIDVNQQTKVGATAFWFACESGNTELVEFLIKNDQVSVNLAQNQGITPFNVACHRGALNVVRILLEDKRIDINQASNLGVTPLYIACYNNNLPLLKLLLEDERIDPYNLNFKKNSPYSLSLKGYLSKVNKIKEELEKDKKLKSEHLLQEKYKTEKLKKIEGKDPTEILIERLFDYDQSDTTKNKINLSTLFFLLDKKSLNEIDSIYTILNPNSEISLLELAIKKGLTTLALYLLRRGYKNLSLLLKTPIDFYEIYPANEDLANIRYPLTTEKVMEALGSKNRETRFLLDTHSLELFKDQYQPLLNHLINQRWVERTTQDEVIIYSFKEEIKEWSKGEWEYLLLYLHALNRYQKKISKKESKEKSIFEQIEKPIPPPTSEKKLILSTTEELRKKQSDIFINETRNILESYLGLFLPMVPSIKGLSDLLKKDREQLINISNKERTERGTVTLHFDKSLIVLDKKLKNNFTKMINQELNIIQGSWDQQTHNLFTFNFILKEDFHQSTQTELEKLKLNLKDGFTLFFRTCFDAIRESTLLDSQGKEWSENKIKRANLDQSKGDPDNRLAPSENERVVHPERYFETEESFDSQVISDKINQLFQQFNSVTKIYTPSISSCHIKESTTGENQLLIFVSTSNHSQSITFLFNLIENLKLSIGASQGVLKDEKRVLKQEENRVYKKIILTYSSEAPPYWNSSVIKQWLIQLAQDKPSSPPSIKEWSNEVENSSPKSSIEPLSAPHSEKKHNKEKNIPENEVEQIYEETFPLNSSLKTKLFSTMEAAAYNIYLYLETLCTQQKSWIKPTIIQRRIELVHNLLIPRTELEKEHFHFFITDFSQWMRSPRHLSHTPPEIPESCLYSKNRFNDLTSLELITTLSKEIVAWIDKKGDLFNEDDQYSLYFHLMYLGELLWVPEGNLKKLSPKISEDTRDKLFDKAPFGVKKLIQDTISLRHHLAHPEKENHSSGVNVVGLSLLDQIQQDPCESATLFKELFHLADETLFALKSPKFGSLSLTIWGD
jgi:ankyrin repeat protein